MLAVFCRPNWVSCPNVRSPSHGPRLADPSFSGHCYPADGAGARGNDIVLWREGDHHLLYMLLRGVRYLRERVLLRKVSGLLLVQPQGVP